MRKRVIKKIVCLFSAVMLIFSYSSFSVSAEYEGDVYYVPSESVFAYQFFQGYGLSFNNRVVNLGASTSTTSSYNITVNGYNMTESSYTSVYNYNRLAHMNTIPSNSWANRSQFLNGDTIVNNPGFTNSSHTISVPNQTISVPNQNTTEPNIVYQVLSYGTLSGNFDHVTAYDGNKRINIQNGQTYVISFLSNVGSGGLSIFQSSGRNDISYTRTYSTMRYNGNDYYKMNYFVTNNSGTRDFITLDFQFTSYSNVEIVPLYFGLDNMMTDDKKQELGIQTLSETKLISIDSSLNNLYTLLLSGTNQTQQTVNNNNNSNDNFNEIDDSWHDIESGSIDDMDLQLQNIGTQNDLYNNGGFLNAVNFISSTFMKFINDDPSSSIGLIITFSLILGLSLTILGKLRN